MIKRLKSVSLGKNLEVKFTFSVNFMRTVVYEFRDFNVKNIMS